MSKWKNGNLRSSVINVGSISGGRCITSRRGSASRIGITGGRRINGSMNKCIREIYNVFNNVKIKLRINVRSIISCVLAIICITGMVCAGLPPVTAQAADDVITLKICNWEEYIDEGDWDESETIDLESGDIRGDNSMVEDFEEWYYKTYGKKVKVEYSCLGTNEELYNMLTLGDEYDLICPSEYMIMKLMAEDWLEPYSEQFYDKSIAENYYAKGVSPFIKKTFDENEINGEPWSKYAAGYMWGVTGIVYNSEEVTKEEASTWTIINNDKFRRRITIKDNVRDSMFAAIGAVKADKLTSAAFINQPDYKLRLAEEMNDTSDAAIEKVQEYLQRAKDNVYSFETDSAKVDIVNGRISAGYQWSGDAVYTIQQAAGSDMQINFAVPKEGTDLYFDGWVMLKSGINGDSEKKQAAESFVNFVSKPENAVRNMYYIGYTSAISGGDSDVIYDYVKWNYGYDSIMEDAGSTSADSYSDSNVTGNRNPADSNGISSGSTSDETDAVDYSLGYFFSGISDDERYTFKTTKEQTEGQLCAQYPTEEVMGRSAVMQYFDADETAKINQMWINVRCFNIRNVPVWVWVVIVAVIVVLAGVQLVRIVRKRREIIG